MFRRRMNRSELERGLDLGRDPGYDDSGTCHVR